MNWITLSACHLSSSKSHRRPPPSGDMSHHLLYVSEGTFSLRIWHWADDNTVTFSPPHSLQTVLFHFHPLTLYFSATIMALWVCMSVFFPLEKGLWLSGSLWELCLIAACVVNYEVHFQRAVQIALWGTAARTKLKRNNTTQNNESTGAHMIVDIFKVSNHRTSGGGGGAAATRELYVKHPLTWKEKRWFNSFYFWYN